MMGVYSNCQDILCGLRNEFGYCRITACIKRNEIEQKVMNDIGEYISIRKVAEYLTDNLIIPPGGTVPATKEERMQEWVHTLEELDERVAIMSESAELKEDNDETD